MTISDTERAEIMRAARANAAKAPAEWTPAQRRVLAATFIPALARVRATEQQGA